MSPTAIGLDERLARMAPQLALKAAGSMARLFLLDHDGVVLVR